MPTSNCDPASLIEYAKCFRCIPKGMLGEVMVKAACDAAGGYTPNVEGFLIKSNDDEGDYILLDDGGRIKLS